jgi:hypothetical protein
MLKSEPRLSVVANEIVLNECKTVFVPTAPIVELTYPPHLVKLNCTKAVQLEGLEKDVLPLVPMGKCQKSVKRRQLPITPAYSFTDYQSHGQTITNPIIDVGTLPTGRAHTL